MVTGLTAAPIFHCFPQYVEAYSFRSSAICFLMAGIPSAVIPLKVFLMDHQMPSTWQTIFRELLNARPLKIKNNNNICKWPLLHATWYSMTVKGEQTKPSLGADHCSSATSMNKAVNTTHCGIGIVSELIKWGVEWEVGGGPRAEGAPYVLSPDALTASCPAKNQTSGSVFPASTAVIESERERQLFSGNQIYTFVSGGGTKESRWTGSWNYLHIVTCYRTEQEEIIDL